MRLLLLFVTLLREALTKSLQEVSGYLGESVTLPSGPDPSWNISRITWSIYPNHTWIATYRNEKKNRNCFLQYAGRLALDTSSGDLMINNIIQVDTMEYTVEFRNAGRNTLIQKVKLVVKQRLQKPKLQKLFHASQNGGCWMTLRWFSPDEGVDFSWQVDSPTSAAFHVVPDGNASIVLASIDDGYSDVRFTCAISKKVESASSVLTESCREDERHSETTHTQWKHGAYLLAFVLGAVLSFII